MPIKTWRLVAGAGIAGDLAAAVGWYSNVGMGVERRFVAEVRAVMQRIAANPSKYQVVHTNIQRALVARFPYAVYFCVQPDHVVVLAVLRANRDPAVWQAR